MISSIKAEIPRLRITEQLPTSTKVPRLKAKIEEVRFCFEKTVCSLTPLAFWERHTWEALRLPYRKGFDEKKHPKKRKSLDARRSKKVESVLSG